MEIAINYYDQIDRQSSFMLFKKETELIYRGRQRRKAG